MTDSGVAIARELAALRPEMKATFFHFDHLGPDLSAMPKFDRALIYTMHTIEQVTWIEPRFFHVLAGAARRVTCLHFEPFGFQVRESGPVTRCHRKFMEDRNWNLNFAEALVQAIRIYGLRSDFSLAEQFLPSDWQNPTSLAIWHSGPASRQRA